MKEYQSLLFPYAYNILGSAEDAKDAIQDVILKYTLKGVEADNEKNYLIKGVVNRSINIKRNRKKFQSEDTWLPEPVSTESSDLKLELREMVSYSLLYLLERINPKERAVFILKEAFAYTHEEIADVLSITIAHSRKLLSRANKKIQEKEVDAGFMNPKKEHFESIDRFVSAIQTRDLKSLHQLFSKDIACHTDGGQKVRVVKKYCAGKDKVAELLIYVHHKYQKNYKVSSSSINHQPALFYYYRQKLILCQIFSFDSSTEKIRSISTILDPIKLKNLQVLY